MNNLYQMKTGLLNLGTTVGLLLLVALQPRSIRAQTAPSLVTVSTNAPAAPSTMAKTPFVLRPVGIVKELEKLMQSGTEPGVIRAFIQSWPTPYSVTADDILRLHGEGLPSDVLTVLIQRGAELGAQAAAAATPPNTDMGPTAPPPYPGAMNQGPPPVAGVPPVADQYPPPVTYPVEPGIESYPVYPAYSYDYYGYPGPYYYSGVVVIGGGGYRGYHGSHGGYGGHPGGSYGHPGGGHPGGGHPAGGHPGGGQSGGGFHGGGAQGGFGGHGGSTGGHSSGGGGHSSGGHR